MDMPDAARENRYATVVLDRATGIDKELTYSIPPALREQTSPGVAVAVPAGRQFATGYVTGFTDTLDFDPAQLRPVAQVLSPPLFDAHALAIARYCADEPHRAFNELTRSPKRLAVAQFLWKNSPASLKAIEKECGPARDALKWLLEAGTVAEEDAVTKATVKVRRALAVRAIAEPDWAALGRAAPKQAAALKELQVRSKSTVLTELAEAGFDAALFRALEKKGLVAFEALEIRRSPLEDLPPGAPLEAAPGARRLCLCRKSH
jgi:primosomal protein N' (replication factor Y)